MTHMESKSETYIPTSTKLKGEVLRQVYRVWLFRKLLPVLVFEVVLLSAVLYGLGQVVFIQRVFENALNVIFTNPSGIGSFVVSMFARAPLVTQILGFGILVLLALLIRHLTQGMLRLFLVRENFFSRVRQ